MRDSRHSVGKRSVAKVVAGVLGAACAAVAIVVAVQAGAASFDPSAFFGAGFNRQEQPEFSTAYDVDRNEAQGQASMDAQDEAQPPATQPDVQPVDASSWSQGEGGATALAVGNSSSTGLAVSGDGSEGAGSSDGTVIAPVVDANGTGSTDGDSNNPDNPSGGQGDGDPDVPAVVDPDPTPTLPDEMLDPTLVPVTPFPDGGIDPQPDGGDGSEPSVTFSVLTEEQTLGDPSDLGMERLYYGMVLDAWKLMCASYFYVNVDGTMYRLENYSDNFVITSELPQVVQSDTLKVTYAFRLNANSTWLRQTVEYNIHPCKVVAQGWEEGSIAGTFYPAEGEGAQLSSLYATMLDIDPFASDPLSNLFIGWSETEGGASVGELYTPTTKGRIVLYPLPTVPVPAEFEVSLSLWTDAQTLTGYMGDGGVCVLPEGIQAVDMWWPLVADSIQLPSTLSSGAEWLQARQSYHVAAGNKAYHVQDGLLFETASGALVGIPGQREDVVVPAGTPSVVIPLENSITRIEFADMVEGMDFTSVNNARIVVPDELYLDCLVAWGANPGNDSNELVTASGEVPDYVVRDGATLSSDGTVLYSVLPSVEGTYFIPDGVQVVKQDAFAASPSVEMVFMPTSVQALEVGSVVGDTLVDVFFQGTQPPTAAAGAFGDVPPQVHVRSAVYDDYRAAWNGALGTDAVATLLAADDFELQDVEGYRLLYTAPLDASGASLPGSEQLIVLAAPADAVDFTGNTLDGLEPTAIGPGAFRDCTQLAYAELPDCITSIGTKAFAGCTALEGFFSASDDTIAIGASAFDDCWLLRFAAFCAPEATLADWSSLYSSGFRAYAPVGAVGYEDDDMLVFDTSLGNLKVEHQGGGTLLYGLMPANEAFPDGLLFLLGSTSTVAGDIALDPNTGIVYDNALSGCTWLQSIDPASMANVVEVCPYAFAYSGLTEVVFSPVLNYVEANAFDGCLSLERAVLSQGLLQLGEGAFGNCPVLTSVEFVGEADPGDSLQISAFAFSNCASLTTLELPSTTDTVYYCAFDASGLVDVSFCSEVPPSLISIDYGAQFTFGYELAEGFHITLTGLAQADAYIDSWKYPFLGLDYGTELSSEQDVQGQNLVRELLGLPLLESVAEQAAVE